ncbi:MAG TPA: hypothetical protein VMA74_14835 [Dyella sp.]|uniref:hypothetical protein n=1 Tax=Dyella sp. TaxID=1869338 RepID=UPI002CF7E547|nr:hypothetical protein [Dyella sp.]HUB90997.1 hypothetical protein [Dyella sp.]
MSANGKESIIDLLVVFAHLQGRAGMFFGKKAWVIGVALLLVVSGIAIYTMSISFDHSSRATHGIVHPQKALRAGVPSPVTEVNGSTRAVPSSSSTATYHNVRFDFAVDYPDKLLLPGQEADDGDGLRFASNVDDADIRAYGSYNALEQSPAEMLQWNLKEDCAKGKVTYKVSKPDLVAYSCLSPEGRIVYEKIIIHADTLATVRFDYAAHEQARWSSVIKQMADSLRLGPGPTASDAQ